MAGPQVETVSATIRFEFKISVQFQKGILNELEIGSIPPGPIRDMLKNQANMSLQLLPSTAKIVDSNSKQLIEE
jgi:hypothetical protein